MKMFKQQTMKKLVTLFALVSLSFAAISQIPGGMGGFGAAPKKETVIPGKRKNYRILIGFDGFQASGVRHFGPN
jgi:hypothetical protein